MNEYFSHDYRARTDKKLVSLAMIHGMAGIGVYWCVVEMLYEADGYMLQTEYERIAFELRVSTELIKGVIENFQLFTVRNGKFYSSSVIKRLKKRQEKSEKARQSVSARWAKIQAQNGSDTNVEGTQNDVSTIKEKNIKGKKNIKNESCLSREGDTLLKTNLRQEKAEEKEKSCAKKEKEFVPPTLEAVRAYCAGRQSSVDPVKFFDHYTAVGWRIGKSEIQDWEAVVRTWENGDSKKRKTYGIN